LRRAMESARERFAAVAGGLEGIANLESASAFSSTSTEFDLAAKHGSLQSKGQGSSKIQDINTTAVPASGEFLAQIRYTAQLLRMEGRPVRNFSLFLNMQDVDQNPIDIPAFGEPSDVQGIRCITYVEGMRQLAIGLNALAKVIKDVGNVVVVVTSEGGRSNLMGDDKISFGIVLGPKRLGFETALYANLDQISDPNAEQAMDPGRQVDEKLHTYDRVSSPYLRNAAGQVISGAPNVGDLQSGVVRALAELSDSGISLSELGNYVRVRSG
jgi:hypothetical protein